jgi:RND family efflux transporter MFP subunit
MTSHKARRARPGLWLGALLFVGFLALLGVRYKEALAERRAFEEAPAPNAPAARSEAGLGEAAPALRGGASTAAALVRGEITHWQARVALTGTLLPIHESNLSFKVTGRLAGVHVKIGDAVKAGQKLAELDAAEARAQLAAAAAQVHTAEVQSAIADDNAQRTRGLFDHGAASEVQFVGDRQRADLARAQLEAARAQAATARTSLENTQLVAPFAGRVTQAPTAAGAIVTPGAVLFRIEDTSSLRLTATISPADAAFAVAGARVEIEGDARVGKVTAVLPSVDSQTRRLPIVAEIPNTGPAPLLANVFVRAALVPSAPIDVLRLPASALRPGSQDEVAIADGGRVRIARIEYAHAEDGSLLVRSGISRGDQLLATPNAQIKDGDPIPAVAQ